MIKEVGFRKAALVKFVKAKEHVTGEEIGAFEEGFKAGWKSYKMASRTP